MDKDHGYCTFRSQNISESDRNNQNSLRAAIRNKKVDVVRRLIGSGTEANGYSSNISYQRPLHLAVISRSLEIVEILLKAGAKVDVMSEECETPLMLAARLENIAITDLLLSHSSTNMENDHYNLSHLHIACMRNKVSLVRKFLLVTRGRHINRAVKKESLCWAGFTPLHFAVQYGCLETVELLLRSEADITAKDVRQMTPLHLAHLHRNEEIIDLILIKHKFEHRNPSDAKGLSHFHIACTRNNPVFVEHFLKSGINPNLEVRSGWRPINFALYHECPKVIELLLESKVVLLFGSNFSNLLKWVHRLGNKAVYDLITSRRFKFQQFHQDDDLTALYKACTQDHSQEIEELLASGQISAPSDFNTPIKSGCTPLHVAVRHNSAAVTKFMLDHGADPTIQDLDGKTPLHITFEYRYDEAFKAILETFDRFHNNTTDYSGLSIFHILCSTNNIRAIESLISKGVDINAQVWDDSVCWAGFTPMHFAVEFRQHEVVVLLLQNDVDASIKNQMNLNPIDLLVDGLDEHFYDIHIERAISDILMTFFSFLPGDEGKSIFEAMTPLHALCINKYTDLAVLEQHLILHKDEIDRTVDLPNSRKSHKGTALHLAMQRHHFEMAKLLLEKGANPLLVNNNGETPIESAASEFGLHWDTENPESIFSLTTHIENFKPSHFHSACSLGLTNVVSHVLSKADPDLKMKFINCVDDTGRTPLLTLLYENEGSFNELPKQEITRLLLENGADVNARDFEHRTALHFTEYPADFDVARMLVSYGADVNAQNVYGGTPLCAVFSNSFMGNNDNGKVISLLLDSGADINIVDERGQTFLSQNIRLRQNQNFQDCIVPLLKYIKKLEVIGFPTNALNKRAYIDYLEEFRESFDERAFVDECKKELESMATVNVDNYTTFYKILFKTPYQMLLHCNNLDLEAMVASDRFCEQFPIYGFLIRLQLKNSKIREPLLRKAEESFMVMSKRSLPSSCLEAIFKYLCDSDFENIILSTREYEREKEM